jgi:hypothetical protein
MRRISRSRGDNGRTSADAVGPADDIRVTASTTVPVMVLCRNDSPLAAACIADTSVSSDTSLSRYPAAPARNAPMTLPSSSNVVNTRTRTSGQRSRSAAVAWTPSIPGICRSISTTAGRSCVANATASAPLAASPTTARSPRVVNRVRRPSRKSAWSSTRRTEIGVMKETQRSARTPHRAHSPSGAARPDLLRVPANPRARIHPQPWPPRHHRLSRGARLAHHHQT